MRKLVTVLMIVLPLLFLVAVFAITGAAAIGVDIHANKLVINNKGENGIFNLDIADYDLRPLFLSDLEVEVRPTKAKDKSFVTTITDTDGNPTDIVSIADDGKFVLSDVGVAKITCSSSDGGYSDSVLFNIGCSGVLDFEPKLKSEAGEEISLTVGADGNYVANVKKGTYFVSGVTYPTVVAGAGVTYNSSDEDAVVANAVSGELSVMFSGETNITITTNGVKGIIKKTLSLNVAKTDNITINGSSSMSALVATDADKAVLYIELPDSYAPSQDVAFFGDCVVNSETEDLGNGRYKVTVYLSEGEKVGNVDCSLTIGSAILNSTLSFSDYAFALSSTLPLTASGDVAMLYGYETVLAITSHPYNKNLSYRVSLSDDSLASVTSDGGYVKLTALKVGETTLVITPFVITESGEKTYQQIVRKVFATPNYTSLVFKESASTFGLAKNLAVASKSFVGGEAVSSPYKIDLMATAKNYDLGDNADLVLTTSNGAIASVSETGELIVKATGKVTVTAKWKYGELFGIKPSTYTYTAVDGVWVSNYSELMLASKQGLRIVLKNDVDVGQKLVGDDGKPLFDDAAMKATLESQTSLLPTTADWTYYKNIGLEQPNVKYLVEFTNDVFGNGHTVSADNVTNMTDATGNLRDCAVFRGPLNFVAVSHKEMGASVKGQDNICFLVRKDGITVDNVTLLGCNDETLEDGTGLNLTLLNNTGTTLELMSDCSVTNSYVRNGRTVVRAFGRSGVNQSDSVNVEREKINVNLSGCVLQNAREFILKIGTNRAVRETDSSVFGNTLTFAPRFKDAVGNDYLNANSPLADNNLSDDYFMSHYVLTDVTLEECVLKNSGLFAVGIESHFAGGMLVGESFKQFEGWHDLAATSYPAVLRMVGKVVLDDWKPLNNVDSSTLIETNNNVLTQTAFLNLNIKAMLESVKNHDDAYKDIITKDSNGNSYVHGGIALYGGGYNYSMVDFSRYTFEQMKQYNINLSVLDKPDNDSILQQQGQLLPFAAGGEDFRFIMFDASSEYGYKSVKTN